MNINLKKGQNNEFVRPRKILNYCIVSSRSTSRLVTPHVTNWIKFNYSKASRYMATTAYDRLTQVRGQNMYHIQDQNWCIIFSLLCKGWTDDWHHNGCKRCHFRLKKIIKDHSPIPWLTWVSLTLLHYFSKDSYHHLRRTMKQKNPSLTHILLHLVITDSI